MQPGVEIDLPAGAVKHIQVCRMQPQELITVFSGEGGEWLARITRMGRASAGVQLIERLEPLRELTPAVTLVVGMPANDRMDSLVEKATELGVARIQPVLCERSVLRLGGERAHKRVAHWQAVAVAASEQCGRTRVPSIAEVATLEAWLGQSHAAADPATTARVVLSPRAALAFSAALRGWPASIEQACLLSGPEGGLSDAEEASALAAGFQACGLGPRTLRADTAPLAALSQLCGHFGG